MGVDVSSGRARWRGGAVAAALALGVVAVLVGRPGAHNPWFWDDLHTIRPYSVAELADTWHGTYDPDKIETLGLRPLETLSYALRYEVLGEHMAANRYLTLAALVLAYALVAFALARAGAPLLLGLLAGLVSLSHKDLSYTYDWVADSYPGLQALAFGLAVYCLCRSWASGRRGGWLWASMAAWIVTLLFKDQGVVLAPVILLLVPLWWALARGERCADYGALWTTVREGLRSLRRDRALGLYAAAIVGVAVLDLILRRIFVPEAETPKLGFHALSSFADQMRFTVALGGQQHLSAYAAVAEAALVVLLLVPPLARGRPDVAQPLTTLWLVGLFGAASSVLSASFALIRSRSDLVLFPLWFYALFLCAAVGVVGLLAWRNVRLRLIVVLGVVALAAWSAVQSARGIGDIAGSMGPRSELTLLYDYDFAYGRYAATATVPPGRLAAVKRALARVGVTGPVAGGDIRPRLIELGRTAHPTVVPLSPNGFFSDEVAAGG